MIEMKISPTDDCTWFNEDYTLMIDGDTPKEAEVAAGKINNHGRMTDEIAELRGVLTQVLDGLEDAEATLEQYPFNRSLVSEIDLIKESLNK